MHLRKRQGKLAASWDGPFPISKVNGKDSYTIKKQKGIMVTVNKKQLKKFVPRLSEETKKINIAVRELNVEEVLKWVVQSFNYLRGGRQQLLAISEVQVDFSVCFPFLLWR